MKLTPEELLEIYRSGDWDATHEVGFLAKQYFIESQDWAGLSSFYRKLVSLAHVEPYRERVLAVSTKEFAKSVQAILPNAIVTARDSGAAAIYYEWERSGP